MVLLCLEPFNKPKLLYYYAHKGNQPNKNKVVNMETWEETKKKVNAMIDANGDSLDENLRIVSKHLMEAGDNNPLSQPQMAKSLRETLRGCNGYPWRRGGGGILSATALSTVDGIVADVESAFSQAFDSCVGVRAFLLPHGKSKNTHFENGADYASMLTKTIRKNATQLYKAGWDGTLEGLGVDTSGEEE
jgi:hypothetical protein|tara:strand:- start:3810 stop:4379 length:570 start_codon:yes stop_codon:yes gene_type:complete